MTRKINQNSSHYFEKVYDVTRMIPFGRVSTYGAIADFLALGSARMVGWALNQCHHSQEEIPAHRVVNRKGQLSGKLQFETPETMAQRLHNEGIIIVDDAVQNFEAIFWHPRELDHL
ncbi:MAG: MGMT family protein [Saprospiraceae bacterium]